MRSHGHQCCQILLSLETRGRSTAFCHCLRLGRENSPQIHQRTQDDLTVAQQDPRAEILQREILPDCSEGPEHQGRMLRRARQAGTTHCTSELGNGMGPGGQRLGEMSRHLLRI